jgi:PKD repeat protein
MGKAKASWGVAVGILCCVLLSLAGCMLLQPRVAVGFVASTTHGVAPFPVEFTPIVEGDVVAYYWNFGDGATSAESSPVHVYRDRGTYDVFLAVTLADESTGSAKKKDLIDVEKISQKEDRLTPLYWLNANTGTIHWGDRAGSLSSGVIISYVYGGGDLAVVGAYIFWTTDSVLYRANLDGTGKTSIAENQLGLYSVSVDHLAKKVYWTCLPSPPLVSPTWNGSVKRANLDGSSVETLTTYSSSSTSFAWWIRCDGNGERYYFSTDNYGIVGPKEVEPTASTGGMFEWTFVHEFVPHDVTGYVGSAYSMALDLSDLPAHYVYWTTGNAIMRCKVDGSDKTTVIDGLRSASGVAVDLLEGRMYWSDNEGIHRAEVDGTQAELIYPGVRADVLILQQ